MTAFLLKLIICIAIFFSIFVNAFGQDEDLFEEEIQSLEKKSIQLFLNANLQFASAFGEFGGYSGIGVGAIFFDRFSLTLGFDNLSYTAFRATFIDEILDERPRLTKDYLFAEAGYKFYRIGEESFLISLSIGLGKVKFQTDGARISDDGSVYAPVFPSQNLTIIQPSVQWLSNWTHWFQTSVYLGYRITNMADYSVDTDTIRASHFDTPFIGLKLMFGDF